MKRSSTSTGGWSEIGGSVRRFAHGATPADRESFQWMHGDPAIPYVREVLRYGDQHPEIPQSDLQILLWNLDNKTPYESYPPYLKRMLLDIDPKAPLRLPSELKERATSYLKRWINSPDAFEGLFEQGFRVATHVRTEI